jgi:hypothetical protein
VGVSSDAGFANLVRYVFSFSPPRCAPASPARAHPAAPPARFGHLFRRPGSELTQLPAGETCRPHDLPTVAPNHVSPHVSFNRLDLDDDLRLRDLVVECAHNLEPDLRVAGGRLPIGGSRMLDLVAVDAQARLVLLEIRCHERPEWILEAIDHYDWALEHLEEAAHLYAAHRIDLARLPRLIFVSASFSEEFRRRLIYFDRVPLELTEYRYLEVNGVRGLYFEPAGLLSGRPPRYPASLQEHLDLMADADRAGVAERLVARIAALDPGVRLLFHRGGALALWEDRLLARLEFSRAGVWVSDEVGGNGAEVRRISDLEPALSSLAARAAHWRRLLRPAPHRPGTRGAAQAGNGSGLGNGAAGSRAADDLRAAPAKRPGVAEAALAPSTPAPARRTLMDDH